MNSITKIQFYTYVALSGIICFFCLRGYRWFPILDSANLAFHEFGHPFFGLFSERLMVYGGTLGQLFFPITAAILGYWLFTQLDEKLSL